MFLVNILRRWNEFRNHDPSDAFEVSLSKSGGVRKRFGYGAIVLAFDDEKHPVLVHSIDDDDDDDDEVNGPLIMPIERDAFSFSDLVFPLADADVDGVGWSSTINSDFNSKMLLSVISGMMPLSLASTVAGKFNGIHTLANKPASIPPFLFIFIHFFYFVILNNTAIV